MKHLQLLLWGLMLLIPFSGMAQGDPVIQILFDQSAPTNLGTETDITFDDLGDITYAQIDLEKGTVASAATASKGIVFRTITGSNYPIANGSAPRSYTFWMKPKALEGTQNLIYTGAGAGTTFTLQLTNQGKIKLADNGGNWVATQTVLVLDEWAHVTVSLSEGVGIHDVDFYINGELSEVGFSGTNNPINTSTGVFKIFGTLNADVTDFRYYNKYLTSTEAYTIYGQNEVVLDALTGGIILTDQSDNNYSFSTLSGTPVMGFQDQEFGRVLEANGAVISASSFRGIEGTTPRTIMFWYKQKEGTGATDKLCYYGAETNKFDLQIRDNTSFRLYNFYSAQQGGSYLSVEEVIDFSSWKHIAVTTNGATTSDVKIYINGVEKGIDLSNLTETSLYTVLAGDFRISNASQGYFNGFKVYKGALSAEEINADFNARKFNQAITFETLSSVNTRVKTIELSATASSGLAVTYESSNPAVATVNGATITVIGAGETDIIASQVGNERYNEAVNVVQKLIVTAYIPEVNPILDFAFDEESGALDFVNTGVLSDVTLLPNTANGAIINLGMMDEDKGQVLDINMDQGEGSLLFKVDNGSYTGVTGSEARTYSAWIKPTNLSEFNTIFYAGKAEGEATSLSVQVLPTGAIKLIAGGNITTTEEYHFIENQWNHIVISIPEGGMLSDIKIQVNGVLADIETVNDRAFNTALATFAIANKFWGFFSDFKYYERAISEEEAIALYTSSVFTHAITFEAPSTLAEKETADFGVSTSSGLVVEYTVSDPSKLKIENGVMTALEEGEVTIEATSFGVTSSHKIIITPYVPEEQPILDFAFNEEGGALDFINTGVLSDVTLLPNTTNGAIINLGMMDEDKGQVLDINMDQGEGSLLFKVDNGNYAGVTGSEARTYSAWIKPTNLSEFNTVFYAGKAEGEATSLSVQILPTGAIKLIAGGNITTTEEYHFVENQWNHIVISIPEDGMLSDIKMHVNGELADIETVNDRAFNIAPATFAIANKFWGFFSDFKYYERAITEEEALELYTSSVFTHTITFEAPTTLAEKETADFGVSTSSGLAVNYTVSDPSKLKIENGVMTALEEGEVTIEAISFGVTASYKIIITPYLPEEEPILDFAFNEESGALDFVNTGVFSDVTLVPNTTNGAIINLGMMDEDKGQVLDINMDQGEGSLLFKVDNGSYAGVTGSEARTYSAWIKPTNLSEFNTIFYAGKAEGEATSLSVQVLPTGAIKLIAGGNITTTEEYHFVENLWNHIVIVIPEDGMLSDIKIQVNGVLADIITVNDRAFNTAPATFAIANKFWGFFSDFKYYERGISDFEALELYTSSVFTHQIIFETEPLMKVGETININAFTTSNLPITYSIENEEIATLSGTQLTALMMGEVEITASSFGVIEQFVISVIEEEEEVIEPKEEPLLWFAFDESPYDEQPINRGLLQDVVLDIDLQKGGAVTIGASDEERGNVLFADIPNQTGRLNFKQDNRDYPGVVGTHARTYSMLIKPTDLSEQKTIMYQGINEGDANNISLQLLSSGQVKFVSGGNIITDAYQPIIENQWNLLQIVVDESSPLEEVKIYINTNLVPTTLTGENNLVNTGIATFSIANKYVGYYSDFRLYNRALSEEEIKGFIPKKEQTITFNAIENKTFGDPDFILEAFASSGLKVNFESSDKGILQIEGNLAKIVGYGEVSITATQMGDLKYNPAEAVTVTFMVEKGAYEPKPELLVNFRFDEPADLPIDPYDYSEYHRTPILKGLYEKGYVDTERGNVIKFNVATLEVDGFKGTLGSQRRSMTTWFKANTKTQSVLTNYGVAREGQFNIVYRADNKIRVVLYYNTYNDGEGNPVYEFSYVETEKAFDFVSEWHHVAVVTEGESIEDIRIYINGELQPVLVSPWQGHEKINTVSGGDFRVVSNSDVKMSDYRWYNGTLTNEEIKNIFNGNTFIPEEETALADRTYEGGFGTAIIEMSGFFTANQGAIYNVTSSNINVVKAQVEGSLLMLNEVGEGVSEITIELYGKSYELLGTQTFTVTVSGTSEETPRDLFTFDELPDFFRKTRNKPLLTFPTLATVNVADFGAIPDDDRNDYEGIKEAFKTAISIASAENPVRVNFAKGTYDLLPENEEATHLFNLSNLSNIIIDGTDAKINIQSPKVGFISLTNAQDVVVQGFEIDYETLPFTQGKVISIADDHIEIKIEEDFPALTEEFMQTASQTWGYIRTEVGLIKEGVPNLISTDPNGWNDLGDQVFSLQMSASQLEHFEIGDYFVQIARNNGRTIGRTQQCKNVTFLNITSYASPAGSYNMSSNEEVNLINCNVLIKEGRVHSANADGIHVVGGKLGPWVQGCIFEGYSDDAVNMKHAKANILQVISPTELKVNASIETGSQIVIFNPREGKVITRVRVQSVVDNDDETYIIHLSEAVNNLKEGTHQSADHIYNEDVASESFVFRDNIFRNARRYGMLIQSAYGVIENNIFEDLSTGGIVMENAVDWGEGFLAHDLLIQNNTFSNCGFDQQYIENEYSATIKMMVMKLSKEDCGEGDEWCGSTPADCDAQGMKNIWIKQNTMTYNKVGILANCVEAGSILDNVLVHNEEDPTLKEGDTAKAMDILNSTFDFEEVLSIDNEFLNADWEVTLSENSIKVLYKGTTIPSASFTLYDATGKTLQTANIRQKSTTIPASINKNQLYIIRLLDQNGKVFTKKLIYDYL
ncbi:LamG-like jellyroll fold domain-containing protein [Flammeovirga aprica]|uniref:BIG2 domain-containing protein n=1 Tax=Flammeovirga aprica JL-4 TaxID=694437 RepID=A0A7X9RZZ2_9BACT|nr:LamG-like jellyroll fold domain-containing protein [Flammeovirga aprica]NME71811.1 hypothetical protein [Flammeovirga aprica JL-4]